MEISLYINIILYYTLINGSTDMLSFLRQIGEISYFEIDIICVVITHGGTVLRQGFVIGISECITHRVKSLL